MAASFANTIAGQTMNLDLSKVIASQRRKLEGLCTDLFLIVIRMRESEDLGEPAALVKLIKYYIDLFEKNCRTMGMTNEDIQQTKYAIIALLDETVLSIPGNCRDYWIANPLQLEYFGDNVAGEEFYRKLGNLLTEPDKKREVLEVYYLCLSLGFEGKYRMGDTKERDKIIDNLGRTLERTLKAVSPGLSPHGRRMSSGGTKRERAVLVPLWVVATVCAVGIGGIWTMLYFISQNHVRMLIGKL